MKKVKKIMVPASSANLGSGFDSIGLCLDLWNEIEFHQYLKSIFPVKAWKLLVKIKII